MQHAYRARNIYRDRQDRSDKSHETALEALSVNVLALLRGLTPPLYLNSARIPNGRLEAQTGVWRGNHLEYLNIYQPKEPKDLAQFSTLIVC